MINRRFHISNPYYSAGLKYNFGKTFEERRDNWGIGLKKSRIDYLARKDKTVIVSYGNSDKEYTISPKKVQKYPVEAIRGSSVQVYVVPKSKLNYREQKGGVDLSDPKNLSEYVLQ